MKIVYRPGHHGQPDGRQPAKDGHSLVVFNRLVKSGTLIAEGANGDSRALALWWMDLYDLAHPDAVEEAALGKDGFLRHPETAECG